MGRYIWAAGAMNNPIACPANTTTLINSGAITLNSQSQLVNYIISQSLVMPIRFTDSSVPSEIDITLSVFNATVGGTKIANDAVYKIKQDVLSYYSSGTMLYVPEMVNCPTSSWSNDTLGFAQIVNLSGFTAPLRVTFGLYLNPTGAHVTVDGSSAQGSSGFQSVFMDMAGAFTDSSYPKDDGNGGVEY